MGIFIAILIIVGSTAALSGGGGGGGGGGNSSPAPVAPNPVTPTPPTITNPTFTIGSDWEVSDLEAATYKTSEYNNQLGLEKIQAAEAYASLAKNGKAIAGNGVTIGIIDSGVQINHPEISPRYIAQGRDYVNSDSDPNDDNGHGTFVASVAAGAKDNNQIHGVAFNSNIIAEKVSNASGMAEYVDVRNGIEHATASGAKVLNISLGGNASTNVKNGLIYAKAADVLTVAAAGNDARTSLDYPASYASDATLKGYVLAVGAVDSSLNLASFSNQCGSDKDYCLVAPGSPLSRR